MALRLLQVLAGAVIGVLISRTLAPAGRGEYAVLVAIATTTMAIGHLSLEQGNLRLWSDVRRRPSLAPNALVLAVVLGLLLAGLAVSLVLLLGPGIVPVSSTTGLILAAAGIPITLAVSWTVNLLFVAGHTVGAALSGCLSSAVQLAALVVLIGTDHLSVVSVVAIWLLSSAAPLVVSLRLLRPRRTELSRATALVALKAGLRYHAGFALLFLLFRIDVFLLNGLSTVEAVGLYTLAVTLAELTYLLSETVTQLLLPRQVAADAETRAAVTALAVRINLVGTFGAAATLAAVADWLVPQVYGAAFTGSVQPLWLMLPGVVAYASCRSVASYLTLQGRPAALAAASLVALTINVALNVHLIPQYGASGAAVATTAGYTALAVLLLRLLMRTSTVRRQDLVPGRRELAAFARLVRRPTAPT